MIRYIIVAFALVCIGYGLYKLDSAVAYIIAGAAVLIVIGIDSIEIPTPKKGGDR